MSMNRNDLPAAIDQLERALSARAGAREPGWRTAVDQALAGLEQTVRHHARTLMPDDGKLIDVDRPRIPSPGVSRKAGELHGELCRFMDESRALRARLNASIAAGTANSGDPDLNTFLRRAKQLVEALQRYEDEEAHLILDSVNTDIGAGD